MGRLMVLGGEKTVVGIVEKVEINGQIFNAKIDTGAEKSSIDVRLAAKLILGPIVGFRGIKSAVGRSVRPIIKVPFKIKNRRMIYKFNVMDRKKMRYKILIGNNILKQGFLIDPSK